MTTRSSPAVLALIHELVAANHVLFQHGIVDAFGHVSVRHPERSDRFLMSGRIAPARVTDDAILELDCDGSPLERGQAVYLERFIHAEVYRARTDVAAVVHSHSPCMLPFGAVPGAPLRPISHMCGFLYPRAPVFEIREAAGDASNLLISSSSLGQALALKLGPAAVVLMRGHGATVVGSSLREAVFRSIYAETNARLQSEALCLGGPVFLTAGEAAASAEVVAANIDRAWDLWLDQLGTVAARKGVS